MKKFNKIKPTKVKEKEKVYDAATELYNKQFKKHYDEHKKSLDAKNNKLDHTYKPINLRLEDYDYNG